MKKEIKRRKQKMKIDWITKMLFEHLTPQNEGKSEIYKLNHETNEYEKIDEKAELKKIKEEKKK
jgi:hypothetical protein